MIKSMISQDFSGPTAPAAAGTPKVDTTVATPIQVNTRTLFIL
jgi:hypothetical protein